MKQVKTDWLITTYDTDQKIISSLIIEDSTEIEVKSDEEFKLFSEDKNVKTWTLVDINDELRAFVKKWSHNTKEAKEVNGLRGDNFAVSEALVGLDWIWLPQFRRWLNRSNSLYDLRDQEIVDFLHEKYSY